MQRFIIEHSEANLTPHSGRALVGRIFNDYADLSGSLKREVP
jgi:hypothetical protein